jgi:hypothetical protein
MAAAAADVVPEHLQGPAMPVSKLLVIANTFLVDTTRFLNHFAAKCVPPPATLTRARRPLARPPPPCPRHLSAAWSNACLR